MKNFIFIFAISMFCNSCEDIITVTDISQKPVHILAPVDGTVVNTSTVTFSWETVDDAEKYTIQIATPTFAAANQILLDSTVTSTTFTTTLAENEYEWRVRAENAEYETAYTSQHFTVSEAVDISTENIVLLAPANAATFTPSDTLNFSWETVPNAVSYTIQIAQPSFEAAVEVIENQTLSTTSFSVSSLEANSYEWRVKALNETSQTSYTTQIFTVE